MCGIAGIYDFVDSPDISLLKRMNDCQAHRGPDESGVYTNGPIGVAHRRLSIIDLETGRQPIFNEDGSVGVVFNGEIYNYSEIKNSLSDAGHRFQTETDTEVLVHLYEEYGPSFIDRIEGMFAFALWDEESDKVILARDRMGIKPLCFSVSDEKVVFGSELPAILATDPTHGGINRQAIALYFMFEFIPAPYTAFQNINKLLPGEYAVITDSGVRREKYYTPSVTATENSFKQSSSSLRALVENSVEKRLMSDVPLGAFLSGGIDSSIVVGTMAKLSPQPIETFTVGFDENMFDESWAAREVADYHNTNHHEYTVTPEEIRDIIPTVLDRLGEPFGDASLLPTYIVSRETSSNVKVALSGDGADELFAGYERYRAEYLSQYYKLIPKLVRTNIVSPLVESLPEKRTGIVSELAWKSQFFTRYFHENDINRHIGWLRILDDRAGELMRQDINPVDEAERELTEQHKIARGFLPPERHDSLARMQAVDTQYKLPHQILAKVDRASMYNSLEVRVPLLDTNIVEEAMSYPTNYKISRSDQKRVLKHAFEDILPESIVQRGKQGFEMPISRWLNNELAPDFKEAIDNLSSHIVSPSVIQKLYDEHRSGHRNHERVLWSSYVYAKWENRMRSTGVL